MKLRLEIKIVKDSNDEIIWKDNSLGDSLDINFTGMFEEGEAIIGTMERGLRKILGRKFDDEYTKNTVETLTVGELGLVE